MKWRTAIESKTDEFTIDMNTRMLLLGSCFAEHIGQQMMYHKLLVDINPTGISYNPVSLAENVKRAIHQDFVTSSELHHNKEKYVHFDFHGKLGHFERQTCENNINDKLKRLHGAVLESDLIFISLGSAIVFEHIATQAIVSNCHKFAQENFTKRHLTNTEITDALNMLVTSITEVNPDTKIILTISPVRHARHGLIENNRSKASLISAVHELVDGHDSLYYFPSYEIVIDDLRDYRFYDRDLVHPSKEAIEYIWSYLAKQCMTSETQQTLKSIKSLVDSFHHDLMSSSPDIKIQYLNTLKEKINAHQYAERFSDEFSQIEDRIKKLGQH